MNISDAVFYQLFLPVLLIFFALDNRSVFIIIYNQVCKEHNTSEISFVHFVLIGRIFTSSSTPCVKTSSIVLYLIFEGSFYQK